MRFRFSVDMASMCGSSRRLHWGCLDVLPDRSLESVLKGLEERGIEWCAAVQYACSDMWDAYPQAAKQKLPNARRVVDRFHVIPHSITNCAFLEGGKRNL